MKNYFKKILLAFILLLIIVPLNVQAVASVKAGTTLADLKNSLKE